MLSNNTWLEWKLRKKKKYHEWVGDMGIYDSDKTIY